MLLAHEELVDILCKLGQKAAQAKIKCQFSQNANPKRRRTD